MLLMTEEINQEIEDEETWFLDSGCSTHMCGSKKWFIELDWGSRKLSELEMEEDYVLKGRECEDENSRKDPSD